MIYWYGYLCIAAIVALATLCLMIREHLEKSQLEECDSESDLGEASSAELTVQQQRLNSLIEVPAVLSTGICWPLVFVKVINRPPLSIVSEICR